jgi:hypothetical protein
MSIPQRDIIKSIFKAKSLKINDIVANLFPQGKGSYYNEVDRNPLKKEFIELIKTTYSIDLVKEIEDLNNKERTTFPEEIQLRQKIEALQDRLIKEVDIKNSEKDKAHKEIKKLYERMLELEKENGELKLKLKK